MALDGEHHCNFPNLVYLLQRKKLPNLTNAQYFTVKNYQERQQSPGQFL